MAATVVSGRSASSIGGSCGVGLFSFSVWSFEARVDMNSLVC